MEEIAQVYARSLFEVATEQDKLDLLRDQLTEFTEALSESHELQMFFFSPYFSTDEKQDGLRRTVTDADQSFLNFLSLLLENHRMPVIFRVRREYDRLWREANHLLAVQITSAVELDPSVAERVGDEIGRQTGRTVELTSAVDPEILGGIVVRVGNSIIDASIRTRLDNLRKQVVTTYNRRPQVAARGDRRAKLELLRNEDQP
jgi:ATP synthase F1 delta subunit